MRALRRYFGLLAQRFCYIKREYQAVFEDCFRRQYSLIHRLETNKLRNVAKFFGHLLSTDAVSWYAWRPRLPFQGVLRRPRSHPTRGVRSPVRRCFATSHRGALRRLWGAVLFCKL